MIEKTRQSSGADESTPSIPQYFSWINNTNEGATEGQTLRNLDYFQWLKDTYGMNLTIYAWDAGNLDGARGTYGDPAHTPKLKKQYPNGYRPLAEKAAEFGCHLGVWGGADGFGNTPESQQARYDLITGLCRDLGFMLFKFDTVCGALREDKRRIFKEMIDECRKYVPDLIVLNHRNDLGDAEICATTFLWGGVETYIDVHIRNERTGSHHRVCTLERGLVPEMKRLTEDHGVCISSCLDFFEDDLIIQAFARSLILAPEIYGNPWLLRDREQERLARIYNLHWKYRDLLTHGEVLPDSYGKNAVSRGDGTTRLLTLNNPDWDPMTVRLNLTEELGIAPGKTYVVKTLHPYESYVGTFSYGAAAQLTVEPFRAALILVQEEALFRETDFVLTNCTYETVTDRNRLPNRIEIYSGNGKPIDIIGNQAPAEFAKGSTVFGDHRLTAPVLLGRGTDCPMTANAEQLYEATCFRADCDSLEAQSLKRSGGTKIPQVQAARDAFFSQDTYRFRGCEAKAMFDDNPDTFFDGESVYYNTRLNGGCLRLDLGELLPAARVEIEYFEIHNPIHEVHTPNVPANATISPDLAAWTKAPLSHVAAGTPTEAPVVMDSIHNIEYHKGTRKIAVYETANAFRYLRLDAPMDRIYAVRLFDREEKRLIPKNPHGNNMLSPYNRKAFVKMKKITVHIPDDTPVGSYLAAAIDGTHGPEGAYCAAMDGDTPIGFNDRAGSFPMNNWEHIVGQCHSGYTYYLTITEELKGHDFTVYAMYEKETDLPLTVWLCDATDKAPVCTLTKA